MGCARECSQVFESARIFVLGSVESKWKKVGVVSGYARNSVPEKVVLGSGQRCSEAFETLESYIIIVLYNCAICCLDLTCVGTDVKTNKAHLACLRLIPTTCRICFSMCDLAIEAQCCKSIILICF